MMHEFSEIRNTLIGLFLIRMDTSALIAIHSLFLSLRKTPYTFYHNTFGKGFTSLHRLYYTILTAGYVKLF